MGLNAMHSNLLCEAGKQINKYYKKEKLVKRIVAASIATALFFTKRNDRQSA